jgi:hypothetical protein
VDISGADQRSVNARANILRANMAFECRLFHELRRLLASSAEE